MRRASGRRAPWAGDLAILVGCARRMGPRRRGCGAAWLSSRMCSDRARRTKWKRSATPRSPSRAEDAARRDRARSRDPAHHCRFRARRQPARDGLFHGGRRSRRAGRSGLPKRRSRPEGGPGGLAEALGFVLGLGSSGHLAHTPPWLTNPLRWPRRARSSSLTRRLRRRRPRPRACRRAVPLPRAYHVQMLVALVPLGVGEDGLSGRVGGRQGRATPRGAGLLEWAPSSHGLASASDWKRRASPTRPHRIRSPPLLVQGRISVRPLWIRCRRRRWSKCRPRTRCSKARCPPRPRSTRPRRTGLGLLGLERSYVPPASVDLRRRLEKRLLRQHLVVHPGAIQLSARTRRSR